MSEWDQSGSGIWGGQTEDEEDVWECHLDFGGIEPDECEGVEDMCISKFMEQEWQYIKAKCAKEQVRIMTS